MFKLIFLLVFFAINFGGSFIPIEARNELSQTNGQNQIYLPLIIRSSWINPFGFESAEQITNSLYEQRADELGVSWARMNGNISWRDLQPDEGGPINWDLLIGFEEELRTLKEMGIHPIIVVDDFPEWATITQNSCSPLRKDKFNAYANFIVELVQRYKTPEFNVNNWELGNEVDIDPRLVSTNSIYGCWGDIDDLEYYGGKYYGDMVKVVGREIKTADPDARVWLGGLLVMKWNETDPDLGNPENFLRGVLSSGAAPFFDVVPYHGHIAYYGKMKDIDSLSIGGWAPWGGIAVGKPRFLRSIMQEYGVDKVLSLNEVGVGCIETYSYCQPPNTEFFQFQASMAVRYAVRVVSENVESYIWYTLNGPGWRNTGLVSDDKSPRPVYDAYQNLISKTQELTYSSLVNLGEGIEAHEFTSRNISLLILWTDIDEQKTIRISQENFKAAYDRDGNPIQVGDNYEVSIGFAPTYLIYSR